MRVFLGIPFSPLLREKAVAWQETYKKIYQPTNVSWTTKENLHVTILSPWEEENPERISTLLRDNPVTITDFSLLFSAIRFKDAQYVFAEGEAPEGLLRLHMELTERLSRPAQRRSFLLHATLARIRKAARITPIVAPISWQLPVYTYSCFISHLGRKGTTYEIFDTFPLQ